MQHVNRSGVEFTPIGYPGVDYATIQNPEGTPDLQDGLYYRTRVFPGLVSEVEATMSGEIPLAQLSLDALQAWNGLGYKKPHGSYEMAQRLHAKAREEQHELDDALEEFFDTRNNEHLVEEIGDNVWIATAFANNAGSVVDDRAKQRLYEYVRGTKVFEDGTFSYPTWYDTAAQLAIKQAPITVGDIDNLIQADFVPRFSPIMNLYEPEEICATSFVFDVGMYYAVMSSLNQQQYGDGGNTYVMRPAYDEQAAQIGTSAAEVYFRLAGIAHFAGSSFSEVVRHNIEKISARVQSGTVDKTDAGRAHLYPDDTVQ